MELEDLHRDFIEHLRAKNSAPSTIAAYSSQLGFYLAYLKNAVVSDIRTVSTANVKRYVVSLIEQRSAGRDGKGFAVATIGIKIRAVKRFFKFLEKSGHILIDPAESIPEPRKEKALPRTVLTGEDVEKILEQPRLDRDAGVRDRAVLEVLYSTGIRLEEVSRLTVFDCDLQGGLLRVNKGKGAKDRLVPLGGHAVTCIRVYLTRIRPRYAAGAGSGKALFLNRFGEPLSKQMIGIFVREYARKAGIVKKVTPHAFRHTFATELVRNGADLTAVRKMLGHAGLRTTQMYAAVAGAEVKATHRRHHPRERAEVKSEVVQPDIQGLKEPVEQ
jgi:integrase/recombinase XerD